MTWVVVQLSVFGIFHYIIFLLRCINITQPLWWYAFWERMTNCDWWVLCSILVYFPSWNIRRVVDQYRRLLHQNYVKIYCKSLAIVETSQGLLYFKRDNFVWWNIYYLFEYFYSASDIKTTMRLEFSLRKQYANENVLAPIVRLFLFVN